MAKSTLWELRYILAAIIMFFALLIGSVVVSFNYLDAAYLLFLITCIIRYIIICKQNRD